MNEKAHLTPRESEVAEYLAWGATKKEIAMILCISVRTVENTARNIFEKAEVTKASELAAWWFCTKFHLSFDLSPLKRKGIAIALLLITISQAFTINAESLRPVRTSRVISRTVRGRKDITDGSELNQENDTYGF